MWIYIKSSGFPFFQAGIFNLLLTIFSHYGGLYILSWIGTDRKIFNFEDLPVQNDYRFNINVDDFAKLLKGMKGVIISSIFSCHSNKFNSKESSSKTHLMSMNLHQFEIHKGSLGLNWGP